MSKLVKWIEAHLKAVLDARWETLKGWSKQELDSGHVPSFENWLRTELAAAMLAGDAERLRTDGRLLKHLEARQFAGEPLPVRQFKSAQAAEAVQTKKSFQSPDISVQVVIDNVRFVADIEIKTQLDASSVVGDLKYVRYHNAQQRGTNYRACFIWCFVCPPGQRDDTRAPDAVIERVNKELNLSLEYRTVEEAPWIGYCVATIDEVA